MRILAVHNFYGSSAPSGENRVFEAEVALLRSRGHDVKPFVRHSDDIRSAGAIGLLRGALSTPWNPFAAAALRREVEAERPDVVHVHNTFPMLSPAVFHAVGNRAARVLTLHNYRLFCPAAIPMRAGRVCTECLDRRSVLPALQHGCYRGSRVATAPLAASVALHRLIGTWRNQVDAFIALSEFQKEIMVAAGLPADRVHVKPSFFAGMPEVQPWSRREPVAVFVGRLTAEKGVETLVRAWTAWGDVAPELRVIGDGELQPRLREMARGARVTFLGSLPPNLAQQQIASARLLVLPSECYEGSPMVLAEAFAFGTPAAVSNLGPLPSFVQSGVDGVLFEPGVPMSLHERIRDAWDSPGMLERLGLAARRAFEERFTEDATYRALMTIYDAALARSRGARMASG